MGHPNFGQAAPCRCRQTDDSLLSSLESLRRYSNLDGLSRLTFSATSPEGPLGDVAARWMFADALAQAAAYSENPEGWLVLTGPSGSGKTHLAAAIANRCIERQQTVFFIMVADLLDHLRASYSPSSEISYDQLFEQVRNVPILILDDLGAHSSTPWAKEKLHQIINHRYNNALPTVITLQGPLTLLDRSMRTRLETENLSQVIQLGRFERVSKDFGEIQPEKLSSMTFDSFNPMGSPRATQKHRNDLAKAWEAARKFASFPEGSWLLLTGTYSCGKTHLAVAIANECLRQGRQVFFAYVPDLLTDFRKAIREDSSVKFDELFEYVLNAPLLILDHLEEKDGSDWIIHDTSWAERKLHQIIVHRHETRMPTVITSAAQMSNFEKK